MWIKDQQEIHFEPGPYEIVWSRSQQQELCIPEVFKEHVELQGDNLFEEFERKLNAEKAHEQKVQQSDGVSTN